MFIDVFSYLRFILLALYFFIMTFSTMAQGVKKDSLYNIEEFTTNRYIMAQKGTGEAYKYFKNGADYFINTGDTINHLNCIAHLSDIEHRKGKFNNAFDLLWSSLPLAKKISNKMPLLEIHQMLAILYQVYDKDSIALYHTKKGLDIAKHYAHTNKHYIERLTSCYLDLAVQYVAMQEFDMAIQYLDSCYLSDSSGEHLFFVDAIYAQVYLEKKEYKKAEEYLDGVSKILEIRGNGFQTATYYFQGRIKSAIDDSKSAIFYYGKSLHAIDSLQNNIKLKPEVLNRLAVAYFNENNSKKAFFLMQESKALSDSLFNTQSEQNKTLFEIKNKYMEELSIKEAQIETQNKMLAVSNQSRFRLRMLIGILILLIIIVFVALRLNAKMKRVAFEKILTEEKSEAILEIRNKELTANALQLIEKEQAVKELMEAVMIKSPDLYKSFNTKYKKSNKKIWEVFHLRFTQTNDKFYNKLLELHPDLTPTDLKHCALIKLNFDSKEMSHLLGISINSVHMARSRVRKKLNLNREDSLSVFLNRI